MVGNFHLSTSEVDERPKAVSPLLYRLWCRARRHEADDWCSARAGFWDTAVRGSSAPRAGIQRMLMNETSQWLQYRFATVCWDLGNFYDSICLHRVMTSMVALSFPPAIIVMPCILLHVFSVAWALSRNRLTLRILFCKAVDLHVTLPGGFCMVSSIMFVGFTQLS